MSHFLWLTLSVAVVAHCYEIAWNNVTYHLLGVPYSEANGNWSVCAFTIKVVRWCRMLNAMGVNYTVYANANTDPSCRHVVEIFSADDRVAFYGRQSQADGAFFDQRTDAPGAIEWMRRASDQLNRRKRPHDLVLATFGSMHASIAHNSGLPGIEVGVGYSQTFSFYRIFESYNWLSTFLTTTPERVDKLSFYDAVIPMCYFEDEFAPELEAALPPADLSAPYLTFVGRIAESKGIRIALALLSHVPHLRLKVAGPGSLAPFLHEFSNCSDRVDYVGVLAPAARNRLLRNAVALVAPTLYIEPFGSIMVESMFLGTPVITTDHAAMSETIWQNVTGVRCRTMACFVRAASQVTTLDRARIVRYAKANYLCSATQQRYIDYFQDVLNLQTPTGWFTFEGVEESLLAQTQFFPD